MNTAPERVDVPILLLQEHPESFSGVRIVLADLGAVVVEVTSIDEAYERWPEGGFGAALIDGQGYDERGVELARELRARARSARTPIAVFLRPEPTASVLEHLYALEGVDHLSTPVVPAVLRAKLRTLVRAMRGATLVPPPPAPLPPHEEPLDLLVENIRDYAIVLFDQAGTIREWLGGAERITGFSSSEAAGQVTGLIFTEEDRAAGVPALEMERAASTGRAEDKRWHVRKSGERFFADGVMIALRDERGVLRGFGKLFKDITRQERSDERLRLLDAMGEATRGSSDPTAVMTATTRLLGEFLAASRCAYADLEADGDTFTIRDDWTAPGVSTSAGVYSLDNFGPRAAVGLRGGRTVVLGDVDRELTPTTGADMFNAIAIKAIVVCPLVKEGRLVALMAVHSPTPRVWTTEDVSLVEEVVDRSWAHIERIRSAEVLREQDRRKDEFLATLAHELRNPLAPIRTGLEVIKQTPTDDPAVLKARGIMERQLGHMVHLIDDLLDVSRISHGKVELRRERITTQSVLDHAVEATRPTIETAGHELQVSAPAEPVWVDGDLTRLAQVVGNLLHNAAKYTPQGGRIELSAEATPSEAIVRVTDNGSGIAPEMRPRVFDLFTQVDQTIHRAQGGLGIGLSLVRKLLELHGGRIEVDSPGLGLGSTFTFYLPLAVVVPEPARPTIESPSEPPPPPAARRLHRILVVDDNEDAADLLTLRFERRGYEIRTAYSGADALSVARHFLPDVVFLDIGMPGMNGYEVARRLRSDPELGSFLLVALTGWGSEADKEQAQAAGFDAHLTKPVSTSAIEDVLARVRVTTIPPPPALGGRPLAPRPACMELQNDSSKLTVPVTPTW